MKLSQNILKLSEAGYLILEASLMFAFLPSAVCFLSSAEKSTQDWFEMKQGWSSPAQWVLNSLFTVLAQRAGRDPNHSVSNPLASHVALLFASRSLQCSTYSFATWWMHSCNNLSYFWCWCHTEWGVATVCETWFGQLSSDVTRFISTETIQRQRCQQTAWFDLPLDCLHFAFPSHVPNSFSPYFLSSEILLAPFSFYPVLKRA